MAKAKKDKVKIPKKIAGVKIPKELRKAANGAVSTLVAHPALGEIVASGLIAAAAALSESDALKKRAKAVGKEAEAAGDELAREASHAKMLMKAAAGAMGKALLDEIKVSGAARASKTSKPRKGKDGTPAADG